MKKVNLGLLGFGTVGQGVAKIIGEKSDSLGKYLGVELVVKRALVKDISKTREVKLNESAYTLDYLDIVNDPEIDIVIELTGCIDEAYKMITESLNAGKHVVTANKAVISQYFEEFTALAKEKGLNFLYEASVGGGIPIIKPLYDVIKLNDVKRVRGIMNGTCNYILTNMTQDGADYFDVLKEAQKLGYAEADPSSDVDGFDTMRKLRILSTIAFKQPIMEDEIIMGGISKLNALDINLLKGLGRVIKLIGDAWVEDDKVKAVVQPVAVHSGSYFSSVNQAYNSITVQGDMVGELKFYGSGAGMLPTANAVLTDCMDIVLQNQKPETYGIGLRRDVDSNSISGEFYVRYDDGKVDLDDLKDRELNENPKVIVTKRVNLAEVQEKLANDENASVVRLESEDY
ncbi:homoserine dehydrogenase [Microaceticoccus formicicus]|uniref:homoserine dehydrogenase n=1 Tax=Microaceticoccus formicicus TaxID=3118105 RepID=UPI003CD04E3F|nr:homoserine dehydrogenase [Peptoniphilaceae bacterium AMB_02]